MKRINYLAILASLCASFVSCDLDSTETDMNGQCYATVTGDLREGYTLYADNGDKVFLNSTQIFQETKGEGLGDMKRGYFSLIFKESNIKTVNGKSTISDAKIYVCQSIPTLDALSKSEAEEQQVLNADSLHTIPQFTQAWFANGYMSVIWKFIYITKKGETVYPTLNLVYDPEEISQNAITLKLCYNAHVSQDSLKGTKLDGATCFDVNRLKEIVPGTDDIQVTIQASDSTYSAKVKREALDYPF